MTDLKYDYFPNIVGPVLHTCWFIQLVYLASPLFLKTLFLDLVNPFGNDGKLSIATWFLRGKEM